MQSWMVKKMDLEQPSCLRKCRKKNGCFKKIGESGAPTFSQKILKQRGCKWRKTKGLHVVFWKVWHARFKMRFFVDSIVDSHGTC